MNRGSRSIQESSETREELPITKKTPDQAHTVAELLAPRQGRPKSESGNHPGFFNEQSGSAVGAIDYVRGSENLTVDVNSPVNSWN